MRQVIKKTIKESKNINDEELIYTLLIDGNNLMKMSTVDKRLNSEGKEYGIVFQCLWQISKLLSRKDYNFVYFFTDGNKSGQLRYNLYEDYKANRDKNYSNTDDSSEYYKKIDEYVKKVLDYSKSKRQVTEVKRGETEEESYERQKLILSQCFEELFVRQVECDSVEGDDLIAYYVKNKKPNERIVIVSGDRDLTQLISDEVCVYIPSLKKYVTPTNHVELIGYTHENVLIKKILCGDSSDNIKGIKGMGETTFFKLFPDAKTKKYTLDDIFAQTKILIENRAKEKKKPLQVYNNILNGVTLGCQGDKIYEINEKIINLNEPLMTEDAVNEMNDMMYAPLDPEGRDLKNLYQIINDNGMYDMFDEERFGDIFSCFYKLIDTEKKYFENNR